MKCEQLAQDLQQSRAQAAAKTTELTLRLEGACVCVWRGWLAAQCSARLCLTEVNVVEGLQGGGAGMGSKRVVGSSKGSWRQERSKKEG